MSDRSDKEFLSDIQEAVRRIQIYTDGMNYHAFLADTRTQDAVIRNLEIIGEAAKRLSEHFRVTHTSLLWKAWLEHGQVDSPLLWRQS